MVNGKKKKRQCYQLTMLLKWSLFPGFPLKYLKDIKKEGKKRENKGKVRGKMINVTRLAKI